MKPFIYSIIFFLVSHFTFSQTTEVLLKESYPASKNTILNLDLDNVAVVFEESFDDKIHFDYVMIFGRYSKRKREMITKQSRIENSKNGDLINLKVINSDFLGITRSFIPDYFAKDKDSFLVSIKDFVKLERKRQFKYKSIDSILKEIKKSEGSDMKDFFNRRYKNFEQNRKLKNMKVIVKIFSIKVPKYVKLRIKAIQTDVNFTYDIVQPIVVNSFKGFLKFKNIFSKKNSINSNNGILQAYSLNNGEIDFRDMRKVVIGSISNSKLKTETSKIQLGEIGEDISITDFDGNYYLYNFSNNFSKFNFTGNYSKLNLYKVKESDYAMNVFGLNTTLNMNNTKTTFGTSEKKDFTKILEKKPKANYSGTIEIKLKNGILNFN